MCDTLQKRNVSAILARYHMSLKTRREACDIPLQCCLGRVFAGYGGVSRIGPLRWHPRVRPRVRKESEEGLGTLLGIPRPGPGRLCGPEDWLVTVVFRMGCLLGAGHPDLTLESASPSPPQGSVWHRFNPDSTLIRQRVPDLTIRSLPNNITHRHLCNGQSISSY